MKVDLRHEKLISQHVDVALVYKEMLGVDEARAYLQRENIPRDIVHRVLFTEQKRGASPTKASVTPSPLPPSRCRRRNRVHDAIVESALKLERKRGREWALALLRDERVPEAVCERILAPGPRQLRTRRSAEPSVFIGEPAVL
jgi:hypothetical protein